MKKKSFNLQRYMKKAFYEGVQGYWSVNSRCWPNCLKEKMDGKNKGQQEAYNSCIDEYNNWDKGKWSMTYGGVRPDAMNYRRNVSTPAANVAKK